ncbi:MAG TPA: GspH/FimT family pseudopilin [Rhodocyclaceae bacterium]
MKGFTLIELMVTLIIVAILAVIAVPSFVEYTTYSKISADTNSIVSDLMVARSEAVKRGMPVTICPSTDGTTCTTGAGAWSQGRIVFVDRAVRGTVDGTGATADSNFILRTATAPNGNTLSLSSANDYLSFNSDGSGYPQGSLTITLCRTGYFGRTITLTPAGRITTVKTPSACS